MKKYTLTSLILILFAGSLFGQVFGPDCPTIEQQQAAYNRSKAAAIVVRDTASQQMQTYYSQLATYYQQLNTANQQKLKDIQQVSKDAQQVSKDLQQIEMDAILADKLIALNTATEKYDELDAFLQILIPLMGDCNPTLKEELKKVHFNRSGGGDGTNLGGGGNFNGFQNPGYLNHISKGL